MKRIDTKKRTENQESMKESLRLKLDDQSQFRGTIHEDVVKREDINKIV